MAFGINVVLLYIGGAATLGLVALVYRVRMKNHTKMNRERLRRLRRHMQQAN
jgi:hypothetical protein